MPVYEKSYRVLIRLYPRGFRRHYGEDLVQAFDDLVERDGPARAWRRTALDLLVTVPRYRLETVMNPWQSTLALQLTVGGLIVAGILSVLFGLLPGIILLPAGVILALIQRSQLARSMRAPDRRRRRRILLTAGGLAVACVLGTTGMYIDLMGDDHWPGPKLLLYNVFFFVTAIGALGCLAAGLRSPKDRPVGAARAARS